MVLSSILAKEAAQRPEVAWFRDEILGGNLLNRDEVGEWIDRITLKLNPTLSPRAVMDIYRSARAELRTNRYRQHM